MMDYPLHMNTESEENGNREVFKYDKSVTFKPKREEDDLNEAEIHELSQMLTSEEFDLSKLQ